MSWLLAGLLLAAELTARAVVTGLPTAPAWAGVLWVLTYYVDDALILFGMVRLAQIVGKLEHACDQAVEVAVARERLQSARTLQAAVGHRLAEVAWLVAAARRAWPATRPGREP